MPTPERLKAPFVPCCFYHIVCKSVDGIFLFCNDKDYAVYLERFKKFMAAFADIWSYSLLPNHTHYICKIRSVNEIKHFITILPEQELTQAMLRWKEDSKDNRLFDEMLERQMNRFLVSYANYFNSRYERKGNFFKALSKEYLLLVRVICNRPLYMCMLMPKKHGITTSFKEHFHNSYHNIIGGDSYYVGVDDVLEFFNGKTYLSIRVKNRLLIFTVRAGLRLKRSNSDNRKIC